MVRRLRCRPRVTSIGTARRVGQRHGQLSGRRLADGCSAVAGVGFRRHGLGGHRDRQERRHGAQLGRHARASGSTGVVRVLASDQVTSTRVEVGAVGPERTQITTGLKAGQRVVLADFSAALPSSSTNARVGGRLRRRSSVWAAAESSRAGLVASDRRNITRSAPAPAPTNASTPTPPTPTPSTPTPLPLYPSTPLPNPSCSSRGGGRASPQVSAVMHARRSSH